MADADRGAKPQERQMNEENIVENICRIAEDREGTDVAGGSVARCGVGA